MCYHPVSICEKKHRKLQWFGIAAAANMCGAARKTMREASKKAIGQRSESARPIENAMRRALMVCSALALVGCNAQSSLTPLADWQVNWQPATSPPKTGWQPFAPEKAFDAINPPGRVKQQHVWLRAKLPARLPADASLYIGAIRFAGELHLDGERIYRYRQLSGTGQGRFRGHRWHMISLPQHAGGRWITMRVYSEMSHLIGVQTIGVSSRTVCMRSMFRGGIHFVVLGMVFVMMGLVALLSFLMGRRERSYLGFALISTATGFMALFDNRVAQLFASATGGWFIVLQTAPFIALAGACFLIEDIVGCGGMVRAIWKLLVLAAIVELAVFGITSLPPSAEHWTHIAADVITAVATVMLVFVVVKATAKGNREVRAFAFGFAFFGVLMVYETANLDELLGLPPDIYPWGMLVFILSLGYILERRYLAYGHELERRNAQLEEYSRTLEQKVQERTCDLDDKNQQLAAINRDLEELVDERTRQLVEQEKTAIIGRMIQGIAHNLKTPLAVVKSTNAVVAKKVAKVFGNEKVAESLPPKKRALLEGVSDDSALIAKAHEQITAIIDTLMLKSRMDSREEKAEVDLNELIKHELEFFRSNPQFKHKVKKQLELDESLPALQLVATNLAQVIENLVANALDAMWNRDDQVLTFRTRKDEQNVYLEIEDSGSGIAPDKLESIFDPFFTTKPAKSDAQAGEPSGTGLGLHTCVELLRPFGGEIKVRSELNKGSTFVVILPRSQEVRADGV
jgi:signal transduction histidine kinase